MSTYPEMSVQERAEQPYLGLTTSVTMGNFSPVIEGTAEIFKRLGEHGVEPAGPPFFRYKIIDMERELVVEAGVPVADPVLVDGLDADVLPAGRYVVTSFTGHPDRLITVTGELLSWAEDQGLTFEQHYEPQGHVWGCRLEIYETDPDDEPDMNQWVTTLAFKLAD